MDRISHHVAAPPCLPADDPTYPAGVFVTLQSLLQRIEELRASRNSLANVLQQQKLAAGSSSMRRKNMVTEFRKSMETWGLLRLAFSAARIALSRSGLLQIAAKSFSGMTVCDIMVPKSCADVVVGDLPVHVRLAGCAAPSRLA